MLRNRTSRRRLCRSVLLLLIPFVVPSAIYAEQVLRLGGSGTDLASMRLLADAFARHHPNLTIRMPPSLGSGGGIKALLAGKLDLAITSRALKQKEQHPGLTAHLYARTPLVFVVAKTSPVDAVTTEMLQGFYSGQHPYWPDNSVARPILRPPSDSDTLMIKKHRRELINALDAAYKRRGIPVAITDQDSADRIQQIPGAFGTSTLALILAEKRNLKALKLDNVTPSALNVHNGRYSLIKDLYIVIASHSSPAAHQFLSFLDSREAIDILLNTGHMLPED